MGFRTAWAAATAFAVASALRRQSRAQMRSDDAGIIPSNHTTGAGCLCVKPCGASLAEQHRCDWCNIDKNSCRGRYSLTRGNYDFCAFNVDADFQSQSARAKLNALWSKVVSDRRAGPVLSKLQTLKEILTVSMITTFDNVRETLPEGRVKVIHGQGVMLRFNLTVQGDSPYSGLLAPGTIEGMMRLGSALPAKDRTFPGIGIKFLRSGIHSANTVALRESGDQSGEVNFFEVPLTTHVAPPDFLDALGKFNQASGCRSMTGISDWASYSQDGKRASELNFPYELQFVAPDPLQFAVDPNAPDADTELLGKLSSIPPGTRLYYVNAKASPRANWVRLGQVVTTSIATVSMFGDTQLSFRHQRMEEDFAKRPEWLSQIDFPGCDESLDGKGNLRPISDWQCPDVVGVPPV